MSVIRLATMSRLVPGRYPTVAVVNIGSPSRLMAFAQLARTIATSQIPDPHGVRIVTKRSGKVVQDGNTSDMLFDVYRLISFLSQGTALAVGTLVVTGTPPGVAMFASDPPEFLKSGEAVECEIESIGTLKNKFVGAE